jgi:hypothetical protein
MGSLTGLGDLSPDLPAHIAAVEPPGAMVQIDRDAADVLSE